MTQLTLQTLHWLHWLVSSQSISVAAPDAARQVALARIALQELEQTIAALGAIVTDPESA